MKRNSYTSMLIYLMNVLQLVKYILQKGDITCAYKLQVNNAVYGSYRQFF